MEVNDLAGVYKEIASVTDIDTAMEIFKRFKGQQIIFPQRLCSKEFIRTYIKKNYNGHNVRELSRMFDYSDRRVRQILNEE